MSHLLFVIGRTIENSLEKDLQITEDYTQLVTAGWHAFWGTKGEEIVNALWSKAYGEYFVQENTNGTSSDKIEFKEEQEKTEHQGELAIEAVDQTERQKQTEIESKKPGEEEQQEKTKPESRDQANLEVHKQQEQVETERTTVKPQEGAEAAVQKQEPQEQAVAGSYSWQELWEQHYTDVCSEVYNLYLEVHYHHFCFYNRCEEETSEEPKPEDELDFIDETENLQALGLPTSFGGKITNYRKPAIYESDTGTSGAEEMPPVGEKTKPLRATKLKKKNRKLKKIPEAIKGDKWLQSYWFKRFSLFSRFDEGIRLDRESWFSVTPEKIAVHVAERLQCDTIIDAFCGSGGNSIQFAFRCSKVISIDIDPEKIKNAKHNAGIYGVADKIEFIIGDFLQLCESLKGDVVFLSPPWGGPKYKLEKMYDIEESLEPVGASALAEMSRKISENIAFFLPKNSNPSQIVRLAGIGKRVDVEHNYLNKKLVGLTAIYGDWLVDKKNLIDK